MSVGTVEAISELVAAGINPKEEKLETAEPDPRSPNQNQTKNCWTSYNEFLLCTKVKGEDNELCQRFANTYRSLCPKIWIEKWEEQRGRGNIRSPASSRLFNRLLVRY
eukprot:EC123340.1.p1 GENE.EC123340.1~~EC123340.1.p1  ORF type:complete len:108 (+),score=4.35 EC123340.1:55-378(+)